MFIISDAKLVRSNRRSISIQITPDGQVVVKAPYLMPRFIINRFVAEKSDWINKHLEKMKKITIKRHTGEIRDGDEFMYLGNNYKLKIGNYSEIKVAGALCFPQFLAFRIKKELTSWYMERAKTIITERVNYFSEELNVDYKYITYSDTVSKWGSCSHDNRLQFNWRLIMAPVLVLDYVVVHELTHIKEKNHGRNFWKEVEKYKPAYKQYIRWLKEHSHVLHSII